MPYQKLATEMRNYYSNNVVTQETNRYSLVVPTPTQHMAILIEYPTYKGCGDYRVKVNGNALSHRNIVSYIFEYLNSISDNQVRYNKAMELSSILLDILTKGLSATPVQGFNIVIDSYYYNSNQFIELIYWLIGQEEINFPAAEGKFSVRLPIIRYHEAIVAALHQDLCSIEQVRERTDIKYRRPPECLVGLIDETQIDRNLLGNIKAI